MRTFIRASEIWVPSRDRAMLEFHSGLYGELARFRHASERMCFGYGEGLPGRAWQARHPIILRELQNSYFMRAEAAREAGLTCGVAIPVFAGDYLLAVVVMYCGADEDNIGAIELWHNDPALSFDLALLEGYYGIADYFERVSRQTRIRPGFGLPGSVWKTGMPEIMSDLWNAQRFLRRDDARKVGLSKGLAIPSPYAPGQTYVLSFLSAMSTPIARRFEIWGPDANAEALIFLSGDCVSNAALAQDYAGVRVPRGDGLLGRVWATGLPQLSEGLAEEVSALGASANQAGLRSVLALPVHENGRLRSIVAFFF